MPSEKRFVVALRGDLEWERALERLRIAVNKAENLGIENAHQLAERAIDEFAERRGVELPRRIPPMGRPKLAPKAKRPAPPKKGTKR